MKRQSKALGLERVGIPAGANARVNTKAIPVLLCRVHGPMTLGHTAPLPRHRRSAGVVGALSALLVATQAFARQAPDVELNRGKPESRDIAREVPGSVPIEKVAETLDRLEGDARVADRDALLARVERWITAGGASGTPSPRWNYERARLATLKGHSADAIDALRAYVATPEGRTDWEAYLRLGDLFIDEFPQLAKSNYVKSLALNEDAPDVLLGLSRCAAALGSRVDALRLAREAAGAEGGQTIATLSHLARVLQAAREWDEAQREGERAVALAERRVEEQTGAEAPLAVLDEQYGLLTGLLQARIAASDEPRAEDYLRLAEVVRRRSRNAERIALHRVLLLLERGVERIASETPDALLEVYGGALSELGLAAEAAEVFRRLLRQDPGNRAAGAWLQRYAADSKVSPGGDRPD